MKSISNYIIKIIGKNAFLKNFLIRMFPKRYEEYCIAPVKNVKESFKKYGEEALQLFHACMEKNGYTYTLAFGSILGAIREKGFIKHDFDIDTYLWYEDFNPQMILDLEQSGFKWISNYLISEGKLGREDTFEYKGVRIDVFYLYKSDKGLPYSCIYVPINENDITDQRMPRRIDLPVSRERVLVPFESVKAYIPSNAVEYCELRYGPNYMIPDANWDWANSGGNMNDWEEMIPFTTHTINPHL